MPTIQRPHHAGIQVADLERSVHFYRDILGFELVFQWNPQAQYIRTVTGYPEADIHAAILKMPGAEVFLEILEYRNVEKAPVDTRTANPGTAHLAFFTDDCDGLYAELTAKGVASVSEPVTPEIGPNTAPQPHIIITSGCSARGNVASRMPCPIGMIGAPNRPWPTR